MDGRDMERLKVDFDGVCRKYGFTDDDEKAGEMADFLTQHAARIDSKLVADRFDMTMQDANTFLMWIQIGTAFKKDVIDRNADILRSGAVL
jgi:hypothetical protein